MISKEQYEVMKEWIKQYEIEQRDLVASKMFDLVKVWRCIFVLDKTYERPDNFLPYLRKNLKLKEDEVVVLDLTTCNDAEIGDEMYYLNFDKLYTIKKIMANDENYVKLKNKIIELRLKV